MNPRLAGIAPSLIRAIAAKRNAGSIDLGLGEPRLRPDPQLFAAATAWVAEHGCQYTANAGDPQLRELIAAYYAYPGMAEAKNVCVTSGSQEALYASITALLDPSVDELLIVEPAFGAYAKIAELAAIRQRSVAMPVERGFAFDVERILAALTPKTRMLVLCSPCNPTARVLRQAEAQQLAQALLVRAGEPIIVLWDEVYRELHYVDDAAHFPAYYPHTIAINSLSKSNALTGLRLGWAIAPALYADAITRLHAWATSTASTYAQQVALALFRNPEALGAQRSWYTTQASAIRALLSDLQIESAPIEGTFYALLRLPQVHDSLAAALGFVERDNVLVVPGVAFGSAAEGWLRISWVGELEHIRRGLELIVAR